MEEFNYEDSFMGVLEDKSRGTKRSFIEDYRLKRLTEFLKLKRGRILDIGCGGGAVTESLSYYYPGAKVYGCDVSTMAISYAGKFGGGKVSYKIIKGRKLPYKDNYFDACIALDVIEHVPDTDFFLKEVGRVLKKNGKFFSHTPCEGQRLTFTWFAQKIKIGNKMTFTRYGHIHPEFTHKYLREKIQEAGFSINKVNYSEHILYQLVSLITYFIPLEVMERILKKDADLYKDKNVVVSDSAPVKGSRIIFSFRKIWLFMNSILRRITHFELNKFKNVSTAALKVNILATKDK